MLALRAVSPLLEVDWMGLSIASNSDCIVVTDDDTRSGNSKAGGAGRCGGLGQRRADLLAEGGGPGNTLVLRLLLQQGARASGAGKTGMPALHAAVLFNQLEAARILLVEGGAQVDAFGLEGNSALLHCVLNGHADMTNLLLNHKASVNLRHQHGATLSTGHSRTTT